MSPPCLPSGLYNTEGLVSDIDIYLSVASAPPPQPTSLALSLILEIFPNISPIHPNTMWWQIGVCFSWSLGLFCFCLIEWVDIDRDNSKSVVKIESEIFWSNKSVFVFVLKPVKLIFYWKILLEINRHYFFTTDLFGMWNYMEQLLEWSKTSIQTIIKWYFTLQLESKVSFNYRLKQSISKNSCF